MAYEYRSGITDKEVIVEVELCINSNNELVDRCPRCHKIFYKRVCRIQYCSDCGQHITPRIKEDNKDILKKQFMNSLTLDDLENGDI